MRVAHSALSRPARSWIQNHAVYACWLFGLADQILGFTPLLHSYWAMYTRIVIAFYGTPGVIQSTVCYAWSTDWIKLQVAVYYLDVIFNCVALFETIHLHWNAVSRHICCTRVVPVYANNNKDTLALVFIKVGLSVKSQRRCWIRMSASNVWIQYLDRHPKKCIWITRLSLACFCFVLGSILVATLMAPRIAGFVFVLWSSWM